MSEPTVTIVELLPRAIAVIGEALDSEDEDIRLRAAEVVLEMSTRLVPVP